MRGEFSFSQLNNVCVERSWFSGDSIEADPKKYCVCADMKDNSSVGNVSLKDKLIKMEYFFERRILISDQRKWDVVFKAVAAKHTESFVKVVSTRTRILSKDMKSKIDIFVGSIQYERVCVGVY